MTPNELLDIIVIPLALALIAIIWPEIQRYWRGRAMEALILRELSEIAPHPQLPERADWWEHQNKQFVHRMIFAKPEENVEFLLSLDPDLVYFVSLAWKSLEDHDWVQWQYALQELSKKYDHRLKKFNRQGKIGKALCAWETLYAGYHLRSADTSPVASSVTA